MTRHVETFGESPDFLVACYHRVRSLLRDYGSCRQCGSHCSAFANVCNTCGTQDPIRLPITWALFAVTICGVVLAIRVWAL